jgi:2-keto-3-deoxy-L-rhamnonate aldolase RhmA
MSESMSDIFTRRRELKRKLRMREPVYAGWVSYAHPSITETFARAGFDFIAIDMEHGTTSLEQAQRIIAAAQSEGSLCLPRPVSHSNDWIKPLLESGADGMVVQMVNEAHEVERLIEVLKYPPMGSRSFGVNRAQAYGFDFDEYVECWNDDSSFIIQVESILAVENIDKLLAFDEVDGVMIGPYDISGSLGVPGQLNHASVIEASNHVIAACKQFGKSCGTQLSDPTPSAVDDLFERGCTFAILGSDLFVLSNWSQQMRDTILLPRK